MVKKILLVVLVAIIGQSAVYAQGAKVQAAGIAFYNLENLFDTIANNPLGRDLEYTPNGQNQWDSRKYINKLNNLATAISTFTTKMTPKGPAIIGVSEVENRGVLEDLVARPELKPWNLQICHHDSPDRRGIDVGLLYNPRYFKLENVTNHRLTAVPFATRDQMCVVGKLLGQRIAVIVNHWPSRLGGQEKSSPNREAAAALCLEIADSLWKVDPQIGVIIMGDLNDDPMDKSCAKVLGAKKDKKDVGEHAFYNPFWKMLDDGIGTLAYKSSWNLFDQIILSGNLVDAPEGQWSFLRSIVHNDDFLKDTEGTRQGYPRRTFASGSYLNGYSDHFPTEIILVRRVQPQK
ncbi:MAG: endonuclease/exonuclease/phosphatase family protein [Bacteroidales bacterium]|nr:endonuclease/exonuclease/phosphatase family protein [Bacteroidales bacterium]